MHISQGVKSQKPEIRGQKQRIGFHIGNEFNLQMTSELRVVLS